MLARGCGRSYGDVAMNPNGVLIDCTGLDRFINFDRTTGRLACEAGVRLADILAVACRPEADGGGWFLPVSPGTRYVSIGGAIANDVHGKNHNSLALLDTTFSNSIWRVPTAALSMFADSGT